MAVVMVDGGAAVRRRNAWLREVGWGLHKMGASRRQVAQALRALRRPLG